MPGFLSRFFDRIRGAAGERDTAPKSVDDIAADELMTERLGGVDPAQFEEDDRPPA
jgi:hypothetical protein